jgi:hypothetical protein
VRKETIIAIDPDATEDNVKRLGLQSMRKMKELFQVAVPLLRGNELSSLWRWNMKG